MSKQNILHTYFHNIECHQLYCTLCRVQCSLCCFFVVGIRRVCYQLPGLTCGIFSSFLNTVLLYVYLSQSMDSVQSSTSCHLLPAWLSLQWWLLLALVPSPAVCGCSAANHQPQARKSTSKTMRTSFHMMGSLKLQLWNIRFPLRSRSWSLMHENAHFKICTCNC